MEAVFTVLSLLNFHGNSRGFIGAAMTVAEWSEWQAETTTILIKVLPQIKNNIDILVIKKTQGRVA